MIPSNYSTPIGWGRTQPAKSNFAQSLQKAQPQSATVFGQMAAPLPSPAELLQRPAQSLFSSGPSQAGVLTHTRRSPMGYPINIYILPNGHRIMVEQRPTDIVSVRTYVNAGSVMENPIVPSPLYGQTGLPSGIAHLDEHCHFLATQNFPVKNTLPSAMEALGARWNASTDHEIIQHELFFNREEAQQALRLHAESVLRPIYNPQDMGQEQANVLNEAALRTRPPMSRIASKLQELMFDRPDLQTLGARTDVQRTTAQDLEKFHRLAYAPTNMVTVVSGRVDPANVLATLAPGFGNNPLKAASLPLNMSLRMALRPGEIRTATIQDPQLSESCVEMGFPGPAKTNLKDRMAMEFLNELLAGDALSPLSDQLVNRQKLARAVHTNFYPLKQSGFYNIQSLTQPGQEQRALQGVLNVVAQVANNPVSNQTVEQIRNRLVREFKVAQSDVGEVTRMMGEEATTNSLPYYLNYEQLANLITAEDIQRVARTYLNPSTYSVVFGVPGPYDKQKGGWLI